MPTGLERWADAAMPGAPYREAVAHARLLPHFADAIRYSITNGLAVHESDPVIHANLKDIGRILLGALVLYLDATGGVTHRRLRDISGGAGIVSRGRATAILWQLLRSKYVVAVRSAGASRNNRYVPTPEMREAYNARLRVEVEAFVVLEPAAAPLLERLGDLTFNRAVWAQMGKRAIETATNPIPAEPIEIYSRRSAGMVLLYALLGACEGGVFPPSGRFSYSLSGLAARFEVSRTHVRNLLKELEAADFIRFDEAQGEGVVLPPLREALESYFGPLYAGFGCSLHHAVRACDSAADFAVA